MPYTPKLTPDSNTLNIRAIFHTVGPIAISMPKTSTADTANKQASSFPQMPVGLAADGKFLYTAYIPATTLRGKLRRLATYPTMKADAHAGNPWPLSRVYAEVLGQDSVSEKKNSDKKAKAEDANDDSMDSDGIDLVKLKKLREENHILDFFGAGLSMKARFSVTNLCPAPGVYLRPQTMSGVRKDLDSDPAMLALLSAADYEAFTQRAQAGSSRSELKPAIKKLRSQLSALKKIEFRTDDQETKLEAITAELTRLEAESASFSEQMGEMQNSTKMLTSYDYLPKGVELFSHLRVANPTAKDLQLLLDIFNGFSHQPMLGGHVARGCGELKGVLHIEGPGQVLLGTASFGGFKPIEVSLTEAGEQFLAAT